ncbi:MAG: methylmalonyl Co-A mutase-associated GTPase MeaB [Alphaproteobacteria bacterium]|jgi:LAO/AO transport system kinase|nr:methylmalonyl Co-A mutase-associated GTPase MeaB [Rhodospirillaceae bacterium]MDG2482414.1 methylmalonyl Co-A mutase-associated GTPase MeaB [Alphaproteobacteria bacterium]MBT6206198.1 methylmalonyl Co-A mutase-associated GTPase MeaB [Rhodospirillaceae bacterium]MBT6509515.1 methylmalonyl Co-A mutase-associated GTPase MeaB [Rhodospirillaceae bacterium]MBT7613391.1 methylmalonyl Co-A mutase-associated GTPase MeaB [Rhodospirillaceae bacterium]
MTERAAIPSTDWSQALKQGRRSDLARAITAVENDTADAPDVLAAAHALAGQALVVGVTGAPGAGKSTLVGAYVGELRRRGLTVGVLAVDPSSPLTGGALLGDRIRMLGHAGDAGVFVRSLASRGHLGGLTHSACAVVDVMDAAGRDVVVVETVGVGQSEVEITDLADIRVVVWAPGAGDDVQAAKAGILEIADLIVVNKADLPQAAATEAALRSAASYGSDAAPQVLRTAATRGDGIVELADAIARVSSGRNLDRSEGAERRLRHQIAGSTAALVADAAARHPDLITLARSVRRGSLSLDDAARRLLARVVADD